MVSIAAQINTQRRPVSVYAPRPYTPSRYAPAQPPPRPSRPQAGGTIDWSAIENAFNSTQAAQQQRAAPAQAEQGGFWGSPFGRGLGFLVNNPVTRVVATPINYLQTGGRAVTLGVEEAAEALPGAPKWLQSYLGQSGIAPFLKNVDVERTEADTRSNWEKVFAPNTTYGYGELLNPDLPKWASRPMGLIGDIAFDPLTYVGGGATRAAAGATHADEAMRGLQKATVSLKAARESGDAKQIAKAAQRLVEAEDYVVKAPQMGRLPSWEVPLPRNRAERANLLGELSATPEGRRFLQQMPGEARIGGLRGFQTMSDEARAALGISEPGLRLRGIDAPIPGTRNIARGINWAGGNVRAGIARLPGEGGRVRNIRVPRGLEQAYNVLTRDVEGDLLLNATDVWGRNQIRLGTGAQLARGNRVLVSGIKEFLKGKDKATIQKLVREAETVPTPNGINDIARRLLEVYSKVTGRTIDRRFLRNPDTYFPHLLDPKWRRALARMAKRGEAGAQDFIKAADLKADELLEDPAFYADNLFEGSGFLEKARRFGPDENGNPQTFNIGGTEVTFSEDSVQHINEQLRKAFPTYKGDFYDTDPVRVFEAYNKSLSRQAGRDVAAAKALAAGNPLAFRLTGDIDATRRAINAAEAQQGPAALLATAQGRYDPTQPLPQVGVPPVVPGSAADKQRRATIAALETAARQATTPEEAAAITADIATAPAPAARIGGVDPNQYFVTTKGEKATTAQAQQVTRARKYAAAAAKEANVAEERLRSGIYDTRAKVINPLRTAIDETKSEIKELNKRLKTWAKTIKDMPTAWGKDPLKDAQTTDELSALLSKVEAEVSNADTKLKRTAASWKGRATRRQRQAEAELRESMERLKKLRLDAWERARQAPRQIREEIELRERTLNQPVRDANERLLRAEIEFARNNPIPYNQATIDNALEAIEAVHGERGPDELLEYLRGVIADVRTGAETVTRAAAGDTPEIAAARARYGELLTEITEIGGRRKRGRLLKADQALMDEAIAERNKLRLLLGQTTKQLSPYDEAQARISELKDLIRQAEGGGAGAGMTPEQAAEALAAGQPLSALGKGTTPGDLPALRAERARLQRQFHPGGRFYAEKQARTVIEEMDGPEGWNARLAENTKTEQAKLAQAEYDRAGRQEAIIWKRPDRAGNRYVVPIGQRQSQMEELGRGVKEQRVVEPIETPPQPEAWANINPQRVYNRETGLWEEQAIPPPRSEAEAIQSLKSLEATGGPAAMGARAEYRDYTRQLRAEEQAFPQRLDARQARIMLETAAGRDRETGPLNQRVQTYTNLAQDVANKGRLVVKRDEAAALRDRLRANPTNARTDIGQTLDDLEAVAKANPYLEDAELTQVESLLQTHRAEAQRIDETRMRVEDLDRVVADADSGRLGNVMIAALNNNWRALHNGPLNTGDIILDAELHKRFTNLFELSRQPQWLGRTFNAFTNLFKTYATLSPGFFVRNAIGGIFMNTADGVALRAQAEGATKWQQFMKGGEEWLTKQDQRTRDAFDAAFASGAGGRFEESGVLARTESAFYNAISSNPVTRFAQRLGTRVEGAMRLGMALDSIDNGMDVQGALQRITRIHFDYSQVSDLDETMKRIIPFWTFMSRNLPLQIQEQWTNPRVYSYYDHVIKNFSLPDEEFTPDYWTRQGAWRTPVSIGGNPLYLQPDLGVTRLEQDIQMLSDTMAGENAGQLFSQANPIIGATLDFMNKRDSFYNRTFDKNDYKAMEGPVGTPIKLLAQALGQTNEAGQVSENFTNYMASLIPPLNQAVRLLPEASGAQTSADTWAKRARYAGVPIQLLTPAAQDSEYWRQWRAMQDENARQRAMMEEQAAAGG